MNRSTIAALLATGLLVGCQGDQPTAPGSQGLSTAISDGSRPGGNPGFFFLPPIADNPGDEPFYDPELFNRNLSPVVEICALSGGPTPACMGGPVSRFEGDDITVSSNHYGVEWDTKRLELDLNTIYRVRVFVSTVLLGYADVQIVQSNRDKDLVDTQNFVPLQRGKTLPIKFHIEIGGFCQVGTDCVEVVLDDDGGIVTTPSGQGGGDFPEDWLPDGVDQVLVIIEKVELEPGEVCIPVVHLVQFPNCYRFTTIPDLPSFEVPIVAGVCPEIPHGDPLAELAQPFKFDDDNVDPEDPEASVTPLENVPAPFLNCNDAVGFGGDDGLLTRLARGGLNAVRSLLAPAPLHAAAIDQGLGGLVISFSRIGWAVDAELEVVSGDGQTGPSGSPLPQTATVRLVTTHPFVAPWSGQLVEFRFLDPDNNIVDTFFLTTNKLGLAQATWTPVGVGQNRLFIFARALPSTKSMLATAVLP